MDLYRFFIKKCHKSTLLNPAEQFCSLGVFVLAFYKKLTQSINLNASLLFLVGLVTAERAAAPCASGWALGNSKARCCGHSSSSTPRWMLLLLNKDYCWIDLGAVTLVFPKPNAHFWDFLSFRLRKTLTSQTGWFVVVAPGVHFSCFKNHCFYSTFAIATSKNHCFSNGFCEASFKNRCFYNGFWIGAAGLVGYFSLILSPSKALLKYDTFSL